MIRKEIGSEFIKTEINWRIKNDAPPYYYELLENGRQCYKYISEMFSGKILFPMYACDSMLQFFEKDQIIFYDVTEKFDIKIDSITDEMIEKAQVLVYVNYYGFPQNKEVQSFLKRVREKLILVEDTTQSIFSNIPFIGDYGICSFRKWMGINTGAIIYSKNKIRIENKLKKGQFSKFREEAFMIKEEYIKGNTETKRYLDLFGKAEEYADKNMEYVDIDNDSINQLKHCDFIHIKEKRRENYKTLELMLNDIAEIKIPKSLEKGIVPLFLPIYADSRDLLKKYLIKNEIFCPVHWPQIEGIKEESNTAYLLKYVLSIPIDQRYSIEDMKRISQVIHDFYK